MITSRMLQSWLATFLLELRLGVRSRRFFAFALFFLVPVALALVSRMLAEEQFDAGFQMRYYNFLFFMLVVPLASLLHGSGVVRDALEQGTWHYHLLTPLRTWQTLIAKYLAAVSLVTLLTLPSLLATHLALYLGGSWGVFEHFAFTLRSAVACAFGAAAYCAVFSFMGVWVKRPLIIGVLYGLVSEFALQGLPGETVVRKFTVIFHVRSISTTDEMKTIIANSPLNSLGGFFNLETPVQAAFNLLIFTGVFLVLAAVVVSRRQFAAQKED